MTFQSRRSICDECNKSFAFSAKPCNTCHKVIVNQCWHCHGNSHRYGLSTEHGYVPKRYLHTIEAGVTGAMLTQMFLTAILIGAYIRWI